MTNVKVNFNELKGKIKPMHATNNGPACKAGTISQGWDKNKANKYSNLHAFIDADILSARVRKIMS